MNSIFLPVLHQQQRELGECLAACAAMVLAYLDAPISYEHLSALLQIKQQVGAPSFNIRNLEQVGIRVVYKRGTLVELHDQLANNRPCIAFVKTGELSYWGQDDNDHAVVVVGLDAEFVYLNDPDFAEAPYRVSHGDFELAWQERDEYYATLNPLSRQ
jgi:ABC-type bacteriocin/lantibiotic exporter with double-glycine peptidase domain